MKKMRTKPLFGRGKLQKMLLVTRIGLLCILAFNITAAANVFSQALFQNLFHIRILYLHRKILNITDLFAVADDIERTFFLNFQ